MARIPSLFDDYQPAGAPAPAASPRRTAIPSMFDGMEAQMPEPMAQPAGPRSWGEAGLDTLRKIRVGAEGLGEGVVGLANLATGGAAGNALQRAGWDPAGTKKLYTDAMSPQQREADAAVANADGFGDTIVAGVKNPIAIAGMVAESLPNLLGTGAVTRFAATRLAAPAVAKVLASGGTQAQAVEAAAQAIAARSGLLKTIGAGAEGALAAGGVAEQARQNNPDDPASMYWGIPAGIATAVIGRLASSIPGFGDADTALFAGGKGLGATGNWATRVGKGIIQEGILEEMPQSASEQVFGNLATGKPATQGVGNAAASGALAGGLMGGGMNAFSRGQPPAPPAQEPPAAEPSAPEVPQFLRTAASSEQNTTALAAAIGQMETTAADRVMERIRTISPELADAVVEASINADGASDPLSQAFSKQLAGWVNSAGFVSEPPDQVEAQLQATKEGRKQALVLAPEEAAGVDTSGLASAPVVDPVTGETAIVSSANPAIPEQAAGRAQEVGLKQAAGEAMGVADPTMTTNPPPGAQAVQQVDPTTGQVIQEEATVTGQPGTAIPGTVPRVVSPEQVIDGRAPGVTDAELESSLMGVQEYGPDAQAPGQVPAQAPAPALTTDVVPAQAAPQSPQNAAGAPAAPAMTVGPTVPQERLYEAAIAGLEADLKNRVGGGTVDRASFKIAKPGKDLAAMGAAIKKAFGVDVLFAESENLRTTDGTPIFGGGMQGLSLNGRRVIVLNTKTSNVLNTMGHELAHQLKQAAPDIWDALANRVVANISKDTTKKFTGALAKAVMTEMPNASPSDVMNYLRGTGREELVSEAVGDVMGDKEFWSSVFQDLGSKKGADGAVGKLVATVRNMLDRARNAFVSTGYVKGTKEIQEVRRAIDQAFREWAGRVDGARANQNPVKKTPAAPVAAKPDKKSEPAVAETKAAKAEPATVTDPDEQADLQQELQEELGGSIQASRAMINGRPYDPATDNFKPPAPTAFMSKEVLAEADGYVAQYFKDRAPPVLSAEAREQAEFLLKPYMDLASAAKAEYDQKVIDIAKRTGALGQMLAPIKGMKRASEKLVIDEKFDVSEMKDLLRSTIVVGSYADAQKVVDEIELEFQLLRKPKNRTETDLTQAVALGRGKTGGYADVLINVVMPNGIIAEIQINVPEMLAAKEQQGHKLYEAAREQPEGSALRAAIDDSMTGFYEAAFVAAASRQALADTKNASSVEGSKDDGLGNPLGTSVAPSREIPNTRPSGNSTLSSPPNVSKNLQPSGNLSGNFTGTSTGSGQDSTGDYDLTNSPAVMPQRGYDLELQKTERETGRGLLTDKEKTALTAAAIENGLRPDEVLAKARADKALYAPSKGWAAMDAVGVTVKKDDEGKIKRKKDGSLAWSVKYTPVKYSFSTPPTAKRQPGEVDQVWAQKIADKIVGEVQTIYRRANEGNKNAQVIVSHAGWYRNMVDRLRAEFGGAGDFFADLLGATSPNTPVVTNWNFSIDIIRNFSNGMFREEMKAFEQWVDAGNDVGKFPASEKIRQLSGKLYGMNSTNAQLAMLNMWRNIEPGSAPKARNFALNLIGGSDMATIDVWAARFLQRMAGTLSKDPKYKRVPIPAEKAVGGNWSADGSRVTGEFGFGAEAMRLAANQLQAEGIDLTPPDLQAVVWFVEKELWGRNRWTTVLGEGGSFEQEADRNPMTRYIAGVSVETGDRVPTNAQMSDAQQALIDAMAGKPGVISARAEPSLGLYAGSVERSFDAEFTTLKSYDPTPLVAAVAKLAQDNSQYDMFVSRVVGPTEDSANARPGVEIYFKPGTSMDVVGKTIQAIRAKGLDGFTLAIDPRAALVTAKGQTSRQVIGIRMQYIPEITMRWDEDVRRLLGTGDRRAVQDHMAEQLDKMRDVAAFAEQLAGVDYSAAQLYDTVVVGKENYDAYTNPSVGAADRARNGQAWFGGSTPQILAQAAGRYESERGQEPAGRLPDGVSPSRVFAGDDQQSGRGDERLTQPPVRADGTIELTHWSHQRGLSQFDPNKHGTGLNGAESKRKVSDPPNWVNRTYYGIAVGQPGGYAKEIGLGPHAYTASVPADRLYDIESDPDRLHPGQTTGWDNADSVYEKRIKDAGYAGYWRAHPSMGMVAAVYEPLRAEAPALADEVRFSRASIQKAIENPRDDRPQVLADALPPALQQLGLPNLPLVIRGDTIRKLANGKDGTRPIMTATQIEGLTSMLSNPAAVFQSATRGDSVVVMLGVAYGDGPIVVALALNANQRIEITNPSTGKTRKVDLQANELSSAYGKNPDVFASWLNKGLLRYWNPNKIAQMLPGLQVQFLQGVSKAGQQGNSVRTAPRASTGVQASRLFPDAQPTVGARFALPGETAAQSARRVVQDRFSRVQRVQEAVAAQGGTVTPGSDIYRAEERASGTTASRLDWFKKQRVDPFMNRLARSGVEMDELALYLYAKHAGERNQHIAEINDQFPDAGSGMSTKDAENLLAEFGASPNFATIRALADDLKAIQNQTNQVLVRGGLVSPEVMLAWGETYKDYVPLKGFEVMDESGSPTGVGAKGWEARGPEARRAMGRSSRAGQLVENILRDHERAIIRDEKNKVAKALLKFVRDNPDDILWDVNRYVIKPYFQKSGAISPVGLADGEVRYRGEVFKDPDRTVVAKVAGTEYHIVVRDEKMLAALKGGDGLLNMDSTAAQKVFRALSWMNRTLAKMWTSLNPAFTVINFTRDAVTGFIHATGDAGLKVSLPMMRSLLPAAYGILRAERSGNLDEWGQWYQQYQEDGGKSGFYMFGQLEDKVRELESTFAQARAISRGGKGAAWAKTVKAVGAVEDVVMDVNGAIENAIRVAAYRMAIEKAGMSRADASSFAKNLTVNFNRRGEIAPALGSLYLFFNPAVQGTARIAQAAAKNPKTFGALVGGLVTMGMMASLLAAGDQDDDEVPYWDKSVPEYEKQKNLILMTGGGNRVTIPAPYGYGFFLHMGYVLGDLLRTGGKDLGGKSVELLKSLMAHYSPVGGGDNPLSALTPTVLDPWVEIMANLKSTGQPVMPDDERMDGTPVPDSARFWGQTRGSVFERITTFLNEATGGNAVVPGKVDVSPESVKNVFKYYTGGAGSFIYDTLNTAFLMTQIGPANTAEQDAIPFLKQLHKTNGVRGEMGYFMSKKGEALQALREAKVYAESNDPAILERIEENRDLIGLGGAVRAYTKALQSLKAMEVSINEGDGAYAEKFEAKKALDVQKMELLRQWNNAFYKVDAGKQ